MDDSYPSRLEQAMTGPIMEMQMGIFELQKGIRVYIKDLLKALDSQSAEYKEGAKILELIGDVHRSTEPCTTLLLSWMAKLDVKY